MKRCFAWLFSAAFAVALALLLSMAFEIVKIGDINMSSDFEPGDRVLVWKLNSERASSGDLVFCRMPFHQPGSSRLYCLRRIWEVRGDKVTVCKSIGDSPQDFVKIEREDVVGRVLVKVP